MEAKKLNHIPTSLYRHNQIGFEDSVLLYLHQFPPLKVNRKPVRTHAMDGAAFPHIIKVKYTIGVKDYTCQKWIGAGNKIPDKGTTIKVIYCEDKPSKARIEL